MSNAFTGALTGKGLNWGGILLSIAPWGILIFVWLFMLRQMQGGGAGGPKGIFSFGKSRAKLLTDERPKVTFADVAGADEAKEELSEIIDFLKDPGKFQKLGGKIPKEEVFKILSYALRSVFFFSDSI